MGRSSFKIYRLEGKNVMGEIVTIIIIVMETIAYIYANEAFFEYKNKKLIPICIVVSTMFKGLSLLNVLGGTIANTVTGFFILIAISLICYSGSVYRKIYLTVIFLIVTFAVDSLIVVMNTLIFSTSFFSLIENPVLYISTSIASKFTLILIAYYLKTKFVSKRNNTRISTLQLIATITFSGYTFLNLYLTITEALKYNDFSALVIVNNIATISCNLLLFYIIEQLEVESETRKRTAVLKQQVKIEMEGYTELSNSYAMQRTLTHDFNNHLAIIQSLISNGKIIKAEEYINSVIGKSSIKGIIFNTNNTIIDALLTQKYYIAKNKGVDMQIIPSDLSKVPITTEDLVIVILNLIDNAIEAALKCENKKIVKLKIMQEESEVVFSIQNTTIMKSEKITNEIATTKDDKLNHGFGLKIIKSILKKYKLDYSISVSDNWFRFSFIVDI